MRLLLPFTPFPAPFAETPISLPHRPTETTEGVALTLGLDGLGGSDLVQKKTVNMPISPSILLEEGGPCVYRYSAHLS